jgi:hypothetical protein
MEQGNKKYIIKNNLYYLLALEVGGHGIGIGALERIGIRVLNDRIAFDKHLFNDAIIDNHGITPRAFSKTAFCGPEARHAHAAGELASTIGQQFDGGESQRSNRLVFGESINNNNDEKEGEMKWLVCETHKYFQRVQDH